MRTLPNEPYIISLIASCGMALTGVFSVQSYLSRMLSICQKIIWFLYFPNGTMAPSWMESLSSGITLFRSMALTKPKPLQWGQAPSGELNENLLGAGSL